MRKRWHFIMIFPLAILLLSLHGTAALLETTAIGAGVANAVCDSYKLYHATETLQKVARDRANYTHIPCFYFHSQRCGDERPNCLRFYPETCRSLEEIRETLQLRSSWNALLMAKGLFPDGWETDILQSKLTKTTSIMQTLKRQLGNDEFLDEVYRKYLVQYPRPPGLSQTEKEEKRETFRQSLVSIAAHNLEFESGTRNWVEGVNQFTDQTPAEEKQMGDCGGPVEDCDPVPSRYGPDLNTRFEPRDEVNWRKKHVMTPARSQGTGCGACWAFGVMGILESAMVIRDGFKFNPNSSRYDYSEQELVDCAHDNRCNASPGSGAAMRYLQKYGVTSEKNYPYDIHSDKKYCQRGQFPRIVPKGLARFRQYKKDEVSMLKYLADFGPFGVSLTPGGEWKQYMGGILDSPDCVHNKSSVHAVIVIAYYNYKNDSKLPVWELKNSWGPNWGTGYGTIILPRNIDSCGIASYGDKIRALPMKRTYDQFDHVHSSFPKD